MTQKDSAENVPCSCEHTQKRTMQHNHALNSFCFARFSLCSKSSEGTIPVNFQNIIYEIRHIKYVLHVLKTFALFILRLETLRPKQVPYLPSQFDDSHSLYQRVCNRVLNGASLGVWYKDYC